MSNWDQLEIIAPDISHPGRYWLKAVLPHLYHEVKAAHPANADRSCVKSVTNDYYHQMIAEAKALPGQPPVEPRVAQAALDKLLIWREAIEAGYPGQLMQWDEVFQLIPGLDALRPAYQRAELIVKVERSNIRNFRQTDIDAYKEAQRSIELLEIKVKACYESWATTNLRAYRKALDQQVVILQELTK